MKKEVRLHLFKTVVSLQGYAVITIGQNDLSNGVIGFSEDSKDVTADEDNSPTFTLKLARTEAFFGEVEVSVLQLLLTKRTTVQVDYGLHSTIL